MIRIQTNPTPPEMDDDTMAEVNEVVPAMFTMFVEASSEAQGSIMISLFISIIMANENPAQVWEMIKDDIDETLPGAIAFGHVAGSA